MMVLEWSDGALPADRDAGIFVGRVLLAGRPLPILVKAGRCFDVSEAAPTVSDLLDLADPAVTTGRDLCAVGELGGSGSGNIELLSPIDLQCVKACGVTFAVSAVERVIEERARGDSARAATLRAELEERVGSGIRAVAPGSPAAELLKVALIEAGLWSQYLEVAIGPDAEVFTKAPVLATVGWGAEIGIRSDSDWNNPEPEIVLVCDSRGRPVGATLGNDVNLRDFEGRSALLLGKAKDNNASCSLGPLIRLFDHSYTMDNVRQADISLEVEGRDGYRLSGHSSMKEISRDPEELVRQAMSEHQYPDGFALFLGTLFAPIQDRDVPGRGFTHKIGDKVTIHSEKLGTLVNRIATSADAPPWTFGIRALLATLPAGATAQ